jgi:hypothetical protein
MVGLGKQLFVQQRSQPERADAEASRLSEKVPTGHLQ